MHLAGDNTLSVMEELLHNLTLVWYNLESSVFREE